MNHPDFVHIIRYEGMIYTPSRVSRTGRCKLLDLQATNRDTKLRCAYTEYPRDQQGAYTGDGWATLEGVQGGNT